MNRRPTPASSLDTAGRASYPIRLALPPRWRAQAPRKGCCYCPPAQRLLETVSPQCPWPVRPALPTSLHPHPSSGGPVSPGIHTCLPRFPGLPVGPRWPAIPGSPFGPISPWKEEREAREERGNKAQSQLQVDPSSGHGASPCSLPVLSRRAALGGWERDEVVWRERSFSRKRTGRRMLPWVGRSLSERDSCRAAHILVPKSPSREARVGGACISVPCAWDTDGGNAFSLSWNFMLCFALFLAQIRIYGFLDDWTQFWRLSSLGCFCSHYIIPHSSVKSWFEFHLTPIWFR